MKQRICAGGAAAGSESKKKVGQLQRLRNFAAKRMRNLAEITADHISKYISSHSCLARPSLYHMEGKRSHNHQCTVVCLYLGIEE